MNRKPFRRGMRWGGFAHTKPVPVAKNTLERVYDVTLRKMAMPALVANMQIMVTNDANRLASIDRQIGMVPFDILIQPDQDAAVEATRVKFTQPPTPTPARRYASWPIYGEAARRYLASLPWPDDNVGLLGSYQFKNVHPHPCPVSRPARSLPSLPSAPAAS